jgi:hypothetical protein
MFVYGLHRELHDRIRFTGQLPFGSKISGKEVTLKAFFTRIFWIQHLRDCREILGITTTTQTRTDGCPKVHQRFLSSVQCQHQDWSRDNIRDGNFELKPTHINKVQQSPFCGRTSENANAHLQHFLEICSTFSIWGVTKDVVHLRLFPFLLLGKVKQWFYSNKEAVPTWEKCSNAFLAKFFPLGKTNALWNKISGFRQLTYETITEAWERQQEYVFACPHHGMEEWFIIQSFYHGLIRSAREHIDDAAGGSFFALSIEEARKLVEKMAYNQSWDEERTQTRTRKVHQLEEVDMLTTKIDLLIKKLENQGPNHLKMGDARVTCEECGETCHMVINCLTVSQDVNFVGNSNNGFRPNQKFNSGWNEPSFPGRISTKMSPLSEISSGIG